MKPLIINKDTGVFYIIVAILLINYTGFSFMNIYWWSFYLLILIFIFLTILQKITVNDFVIRTNFKYSSSFLMLFAITGFFSTLFNQANLFDSLYVILFRLLPILLLIISYDFALKEIWYDKNAFFDKIEKIYFILFIIILPIGLFQKYVLNLSFDDISGFTSNAHIYSFIILFSSIFFFLKKKTVGRFLLILISIFISILADFKIGILSFILSFFITLLLYKKRSIKSVLGYIFIGSVSVTALIGAIYLFRNQLPARFSLLFIFEDISIKSLLLNLDSTFPADLELFKGYIQLYKYVLDDFFKFLFGVGPGNYATNIAMSKEKYYAYIYIIQYREILDSFQIANGSLLSRNGVLINIIGEFGHIGTFLYLTSLIIILSFPIRFFRRFQQDIRNFKKVFPYLFVYIMLIIYTIIEIPVFPVLNEGINLSAIAYFGFLLIKKIQLEKD